MFIILVLIIIILLGEEYNLTDETALDTFPR